MDQVIFCISLQTITTDIQYFTIQQVHPESRLQDAKDVSKTSKISFQDLQQALHSAPCITPQSERHQVI